MLHTGTVSQKAKYLSDLSFFFIQLAKTQLVTVYDHEQKKSMNIHVMHSCHYPDS